MGGHILPPPWVSVSTLWVSSDSVKDTRSVQYFDPRDTLFKKKMTLRSFRTLAYVRNLF